MSRLRPRRGADERGAISVLILGLIVALFLIAGLVIDGGQAINGRQKAFDDAEQAARAGANEIDVGALRSSGQVVILPGEAQAAAARFLTSQGYGPTTFTVSADGDSVTVTTTTSVDTTLLQLVGFSSFDVRGQATAEAATGNGEVP